MSDNNETTQVNPDLFHNYFTMPNCASYELNTDEFRLYAHFRFRAGNGGQVWERLETTAIYTGIGVNKIKAVRASLKAKGYITVTERDGKTLVITCNPDVWERNAQLSKQRPTLEQIYEAQTGKPYALRGEGLSERGKVGSANRKAKELEQTTNDSVTTNQTVATTTNGTVDATTNQTVVRTIPNEQEPNKNNNTLPETSSGDDTPPANLPSEVEALGVRTEVSARPPRSARDEMFEWVLLNLFGLAYKAIPPKPKEGEDAHKELRQQYARVGKISNSLLEHFTVSQLDVFFKDYKRSTKSKSNPNGLAFPRDVLKILQSYNEWKQTQASPAPKSEFQDWMLGW